MKIAVGAGNLEQSVNNPQYAHGILYNGAGGYDQERANTVGTLLASAARTTTATSTTQANVNARGVVIFGRVTAGAGAGGLTPAVNAINPLTGEGHTIWQGAAIAAQGYFTYIIYPGASGGSATAVVGIPLPREWSFRLTAADGTSYTYSFSYAYIL